MFLGLQQRNRLIVHLLGEEILKNATDLLLEDKQHFL